MGIKASATCVMNFDGAIGYLIGPENVDACLAPLLWRLKKLDIDLGAKAKPIHDYAKRLFSKASFKESLTDCEKEYNA